MTHHEAINVFEFTEPRVYLQEVFEHLKKKRRGFQLKTFAQTAGFRSPSSLSMVLNGQRTLSTDAAQKIARALALPARKREYFLAMARLPNASSPAERIEIKEAMLKWREKRGTQLLPSQHYRFLANWYYSVLYVLGGMKATSWDVHDLAERLGGRVSTEQIKIALSDLLALGMLRFENGRFVRGASSLSTAEDVLDDGIFKYHYGMSALAQSALDQALADREMNGVTVAIPRELLPRVKEKIRTFRKEIDEYLTNFESDAEDVYQINLQLFRLTEKGNRP